LLLFINLSAQHMGCLDREASIYLGDVVSVVRREAPGMDLEIYSHPGDFFTRLARGQLHLAISGLLAGLED